MDFVGNEHLKSYFLKLIKENNLNHAYLFHGLQGVGKRTLALNIARELFNTKENIYNKSNQTIENHPDLFLIDKNNSEIYINEARQLKDFLFLTPVFSEYRIAIINNVHNLNQQAANAILKILEEPPSHSILFLITHLEDRVLPTISSRCEEAYFLPIKKEAVVEHLKKSGFKDEVSNEAVKYAGGSLGLANNLAKNIKDFRENVKLLYKLAESDYNFRFSFVKNKAENFDFYKKVLNDWVIYLNSDLAELEKEKVFKRKEILKNAIKLSQILSFSHLNHRLAFENFLLKL